jgi:hypothetical protein
LSTRPSSPLRTPAGTTLRRNAGEERTKESSAAKPNQTVVTGLACLASD